MIINPGRPAEFTFNSEELKIELDELVTESAVQPYLHTLYSMPHMEGDGVGAVLLENKSGRFAVKAKYFIDATGDADLCAQFGATYKRMESLQPPTSCAKFHGLEAIGLSRFKELIRTYGEEFGLRKDGGWGGSSACVPGVSFHAETHVYDTDCSDGDMLTAAEIEGRRQIRAMMDIVRKYGSDHGSISLAALCAYIGVRETRHIKSRHPLTVDSVLSGARFEDAIANGTRQADIHHHDKPGMTFKFLDGRETYSSNDVKWEGRWRPESAENPTFWQIPYRSLLPEGPGNVIACGRSIDADPEAFGAVRLMVSTNQMGEAAGVAAFLALSDGKRFDQVDPLELRSALERGGSIML
ncbi:MAG TPA: FAD-dependent oxidoreductase [Clostridia bacterium]|nr:FAD-dependent oxidoreductase [Clostridia bacterium]